MHTIRPLFLCLLGWLLAHPGSVWGQQRGHLAPAPFPQPNLHRVPFDSAALARTNIDRMPILKPDLSKLAKMPILKIDSLSQFPMPRLEYPRFQAPLFEQRKDAKKPGR